MSATHPKVRRAANKAERAAWNRATAQFRFLAPRQIAEPKPRPQTPALLLRQLPKVAHFHTLGLRPSYAAMFCLPGVVPVIHRRSRAYEVPTCLGVLADAIVS